VSGWLLLCWLGCQQPTAACQQSFSWAIWCAICNVRFSPCTCSLVCLPWLPSLLLEQPQPDDKDSGTPFNVPTAGYEQDASLMEQLRWVGRQGQGHFPTRQSCILCRQGQHAPAAVVFILLQGVLQT
jgi:hypothetical protein